MDDILHSIERKKLMSRRTRDLHSVMTKNFLPQNCDGIVYILLGVGTAIIRGSTQ